MRARRRIGRAPATVALVLGALVVPTPASAAIFRVGSTADAIDATPGDGHCAAAPPASGACTLRAAIEEANSNTDPDAVVLPRGHYVLSVAGDNEDAAASGDLDLTTPVTIGGANARTTIVDAHGIDRVFDVLPGADAFIRAVTVTGGTGASGGGGGIEDSGTLRVDDASISGNSVGSELSGGGIDVAGSLELTRSLVSRNRSVSGGGIKNGGTLSVVDSTIARNESGDSGPNHNGNGGGIDASANTHTTVAYSTIVGNRCWNGSGCGAGINNAASVSNSILARNIESQAGIPSVPGSCGNGADHVIDEGHNVDDVDSNCNLTASTSRRNVNPRLGPLANNGGPTDTFALLEGSPAINRGGNAACSPTDQRGAPRKQFAVCDSGSFEVQPAPRIAELRVKPESFRAEGGGVAATAGSKPAGATVSYRDSRAARTTFTVLRRSRGVRSGKRCVAPPKKPKSGDQSQRCIRFVPVWSFSHQDVVGSNHFHFSGRHNGTKLRPHRYRLRAVASMWGVSSKPKHLSLTIVR